MTVDSVQTIIDNNEKVLLDFHAKWCGPCKTQKPILEEVERRTDVKVVYLDVDDNQELSEKYQLSSVPTLVYYRNGEKVHEEVGLMTEEHITNLFA